MNTIPAALAAKEPKHYFAGTHRRLTPEETLEAYGPLLPRFQITRLADITDLDCLGVPVFLAVRPNAKGLSVAQGKGLSRAAAKASAMMESIECWHGENINKPLRYESVVEMRNSGLVVCEVGALMLRNDRRTRLDVPYLWVEGYDLLKERSCWVPWEAVSTNFVLSPNHLPTFFMSTNGLASGNGVLEAICHGLLEVIERDAITLWEVGGGRRERPIAPEAVPNLACRQFLEDWAKDDLNVLLWNITSDLGIPAFAATMFDGLRGHRTRTVGMFSGYGCHLSASVAVARAITEAAQSRLTVISGSRDDLLPHDYLNCRNEDDLADVLEISRLRKSIDMPPDIATPSFNGDLARLLDAVRHAGIENVVAVNLMREEIGVPVVKVVVPGLEGVSLARNCALGKRAEARLAELAT